MQKPENNDLQKIIDERIKTVLSFTSRKLTDTPTDDLSVVNRKYVNLNGTTAQRPVGSVIGQHYFDTTINKPIWRKANGAWVDATSSVVG